DVAWPVETRGFSSRGHNEAIAITPGGGRVGSVLSGSLDTQLSDAAGETGRARVLDLDVSELEAAGAGLSCGGRARCLIVAADELPGDLWGLLRDRAPVCLVSHLDGSDVLRTEIYT